MIRKHTESEPRPNYPRRNPKWIPEVPQDMRTKHMNPIYETLAGLIQARQLIKTAARAYNYPCPFYFCYFMFKVALAQVTYLRVHFWNVGIQQMKVFALGTKTYTKFWRLKDSRTSQTENTFYATKCSAWSYFCYQFGNSGRLRCNPKIVQCSRS